MEAERKKAIKNLEKALKYCGELGIRICGMDDSLIWATDDIIKGTPDAGNDYNPVADTYKFHAHSKEKRIGEIKVKGIYIDSGGW
jgi:hypothetical protein